MSRPSDNMQPAGKRRPGEQLTKDNADDDDEGPAIDPGTWGKADQATMARRKVVRVRRGGGAAEPAPAPQPAADEPAGAANPFAGVSLAGGGDTAANLYAGVSLLGAAKAPEVEKAAEPAAVAQDTAAAKDAAAAAQAEAASKPTGESAAAEETPKEDKVAADAKETAAEAGKLADEPAVSASKAEATEAADKKDEAADKKDSAPSTSLFGGAAAGGFGALGSTTGGFGSVGTSGGFGGFGGFAAAAKEGASLFGSYTAPQPGSLFAPVPAFGAAGQSKDGEGNGPGEEGEGAEGDAVFGGPEIAPVVQLSEVPKQTGEEEEDTLYSADGSLFEFVNGKEWRERGKGEIRINLRKGTHQARLVMRQRGSQRLLLNANLYQKMITSKMVGGKGVTFAAVNAAPVAVQEGKEEKAEGAASQESQEKGSNAEIAASATPVMRTYAFKVKSSQKIDEFVSTVDQYKAGTAAPAEAAAAENAV